jgi:hypothetical protein
MGRNRKTRNKKIPKDDVEEYMSLLIIIILGICIFIDAHNKQKEIAKTWYEY